MYSHKQTAFVGNIGIYSGLFLITYASVVFAKDPNLTWGHDYNCNITVDHYCDVSITEE